jgi:hypothetical protein
MALRLFDPCPFNFSDATPTVGGSTVSGGTSLSGYEDVIRVDGGGFWTVTCNNGDFGDRDEAGRAVVMAWKALMAGMAGGSVAIIYAFHGRLHQPVLDSYRSPHSDDTSFSDDSLYVTPGAASTVLAVVNGQIGGNRATILDIAITSERSLIGGERFSYIGANGWGERAAEIASVEDINGGKRITFQPPIRGGIAVGDPLDFDNVRCRMRRTSLTEQLADGVFMSATVSFQEDMRPPPPDDDA